MGATSIDEFEFTIDIFKKIKAIIDLYADVIEIEHLEPVLEFARSLPDFDKVKNKKLYILSIHDRIIGDVTKLLKTIPTPKTPD